MPGFMGQVAGHVNGAANDDDEYDDDDDDEDDEEEVCVRRRHNFHLIWLVLTTAMIAELGS